MPDFPEYTVARIGYRVVLAAIFVVFLFHMDPVIHYIFAWIDAIRLIVVPIAVWGGIVAFLIWVPYKIECLIDKDEEMAYRGAQPKETWIDGKGQRNTR